jgi:hypothetical protein
LAISIDFASGLAKVTLDAYLSPVPTRMITPAALSYGRTSGGSGA